MSSNDIQIGGNHYQKRDYQHWDFVCDLKLHYLIACATKYIARWRDKNGIEDLRKTLHYISKKVERNIEVNDIAVKYIEYVDKFAAQLQPIDAEIFYHIMFDNDDEATKLLNDLISDLEFGATSDYVRG